MAFDAINEKYAAIRDAANNPDAPATEITEEQYLYALNVLPPAYMSGGFFVSEQVTADDRGLVYTFCRQIGDRYYTRHAVPRKPETHRINGASGQTLRTASTRRQGRP